jgi:hypothetical protein
MEGCFGAHCVRSKLFPFLFFEVEIYAAFNSNARIINIMYMIALCFLNREFND